MDLYEVILHDGSWYEPFSNTVGMFDSEEKAKEAVAKIEELIIANNEDHCTVFYKKSGKLNELNKEVLEYWNLFD